MAVAQANLAERYLLVVLRLCGYILAEQRSLVAAVVSLVFYNPVDQEPLVMV